MFKTRSVYENLSLKTQSVHGEFAPNSPRIASHSNDTCSQTLGNLIKPTNFKNKDVNIYYEI